MLILAVLLAAWLVGLVYISSQRWLLDTAGEPRVDLISGETRVLPGTHRSRSVLRLAVIELEPGPDRLLVLRAASGPGFVLQLVDRNSQQPVRTMRYPARLEIRNYAIVLKPDDLARRLRIDLRGRSSEDLTIEAAVLATLPPRVDWIPRLLRWLGPILVILFLLWQRGSFVRYFLPSIENKPEAPAAHWDLLTAFLVFVGCFLVFRAAPVQQLIDSKFTTAVSHYLMTQATFSLPPEFAPTERANETYILQAVGKKTYHFFSDAPSVLNIPFVAAFEQFGMASVAPDGRFLRENERRILVFAAAFLAATLCSVLFLTARLWLPPPWCLGLVMVFAFGSQIFSVISRAYWSHAWAVLLLALAILLLVTPWFKHRAWIYVAICTLLCWAYFCRPPLSLSIVGVTLYIFLRRRKCLPYFLTTGLVWATLFVAYSLSNFDSVLPPYFLSSHLRSGRLAGGILLTSYPSAMLGTLLSPGRGLFLYVPILLAILFVVIRRWRWIPDKTLAVTALAVCVAHWQLISLFRNWWGGQCFGPRLMSDVLPWFFLLGVLAVAALRAAAAQGRFQWSAAKVIALALVMAASIFVNTRGAIARETAHGAGIWNWRYPQFMAGLISRPNQPPQP
jgi:hypothetical protein